MGSHPPKVLSCRMTSLSHKTAIFTKANYLNIMIHKDFVTSVQSKKILILVLCTSLFYFYKCCTDYVVPYLCNL